MKNDFIKNKLNQPKPKKSNSKTNRILAFVLLGLFVFWSICSVLGLIAFFKLDKSEVKSAYADLPVLANDTYRDTINVNPSSSFVYKHYDFGGKATNNFSSALKLTLTTNVSLGLSIYLRFSDSTYIPAEGFQLFYNGNTVMTPAFSRVSVLDVDYFKCDLSASLVNTIINSYGGEISVISLTYDYSPKFFIFDLFVTRGNPIPNQMYYFEGFLDSDNFNLGYSQGLISSNYSEFFNGSGTLYYTTQDSPTQSSTTDLSFVPSELSDYFSNGVFLLSEYIVDTIGDDISTFTSASLVFSFNRHLNISPYYFLNTNISGAFSDSQRLGLTIRYYDYSQDTGQRVYASSEPVVTYQGTRPVVEENFFTINRNQVSQDGELIYTYGAVASDTFILSINASLFLRAIENDSNSITLGFPNGYNNGYQSGYIDGQLSFDGDASFNEGYELGSQFAQAEYQRGYEAGVKASSDYSWLGLFGAVVDAPIQALTGLLNFEILGFNMMSFFMSIITLAIIIFVVRLFI